MPSMEDALAVVGDLKDWLNDPKQQELRRSVAIWVRNALTHHSEYKLLLPTVDNLQELHSMLSTQVGKWAQRYRHEGLQEGHQEGHQEGLKQGETKILLKMLQLRFGVLPEWVQSRLADADLAEIEIWSERILTASSLDGVFL